MVAYSFKPMFVQPIRAKTKAQTVRAVGRRRHARPGDALQLYTGMRTKACFLIARGVCSIVIPIRIVNGRGSDGWHVEIDGWELEGRPALDRFARLDGFRGAAEMRRFWREEHGPGVFEGVIVRWDPAELQIPDDGRT